MQNLSININGEKKDNKISILVFFYLLSILLLFVEENSSYRNLPYQLLSIVLVIIFIMSKVRNGRVKVRTGIAVYIVICATTGVINYLIIRNSTLLNVIECSVFNTIIACMLIEKRVNSKWIKYACYVFIILFLYRITQMGLFERITRFSNNQVSVALLIPIILYYVITDINDEEFSMLPASLTMIISFLSRGRTGIITTTILFIAVFFKYFNVESLVKDKGQRKKLRRVLLGLVILIALIVTAYTLFASYSDQILYKFYNRGLDNTSRQIIWGEYIKTSIENVKYFLFGSPKRNLMMGQYFSNNTHNSFISIHANNGIIMLAFCLGLLVKALRYALKNKYYIYFVCIVVFCLRSFFDNMFWGTWGTTVFVMLLFIPLLRPGRVGNEV